MSDDIERLRHEYEDRNHRLANCDLYSPFNKATLFTIHQRQVVTLGALKKHGFTNLSDISILEMGCGKGGILTEYLGFGASPDKLYGVDLLFNRLLQAHKTLPSSGLTNANGQSLPFPSKTFNLVLQYTAISSILDPTLRRDICAEMLRVLEPGGIVLSYDFWLNPTNPHTRGIRPTEIRSLFPNCIFEFKKITLAPPLTRKIVPVSKIAAEIIESLRILNSHYLVIIKPINDQYQ